MWLPVTLRSPSVSTRTSKLQATYASRFVCKHIEDKMSRGVVSAMIRLAILIEHRLVTDRQTDGQRAIAYYHASILSIASRSKKKQNIDKAIGESRIRRFALCASWRVTGNNSPLALSTFAPLCENMTHPQNWKYITSYSVVRG